MNRVPKEMQTEETLKLINIMFDMKTKEKSSSHLDGLDAITGEVDEELRDGEVIIKKDDP